MTPSNRHPRTAARGLPRAFLLQAASTLLTVLLTAPASAPAQGMIQFDVGLSTFTQYMVSDNGANFQQLTSFPQTPGYHVLATTRSDYPGGRMHLYSLHGTTSSGTLCDIPTVWSEATGQSKAITSINGPAYVSVIPGSRWSNDGQDRFVSFGLQDATGQVSVYRAWVSAAEIASANYQPVTLADVNNFVAPGTPRLQFVAQWNSGSGASYWWSHDGSGFYYVDPRSTRKTSNNNLIRVKTVGVGVTMDDDPIVFTAPANLAELRVGPAVDPLNPDRYLVASAIGTGILAVDLATSTSRWLATQTGTGLSSVRGPAFSPDGFSIAFGGSRSVTTTIGKKKTTTTSYGVYTVPFSGGPIAPVTEVTGTGYLTVNSWNNP